MNILDNELQNTVKDRARRKALAKKMAFKKRLHTHKMLEKQEQMKLRYASVAAGAAWLAVAVQLIK